MYALIARIGLLLAAIGLIVAPPVASQSLALRNAAVYAQAKPALLPVGARLVIYGDGIVADTVASGGENPGLIAVSLLNGRVRFAVGWMQGHSGGDMDTTWARRDFTALQKADIVVVGNMGHNPEIDGSGALMGADPSVSPTLINKWKRNVQYQFDNLAPHARLVVWTTVRSTTSEPYAAQVNAAQKAFIASLGPRAVLFDAYAVFDPVTMANTGDGVHPNQVGGIVLGTALAPVLDVLVMPASRDTILADTGSTNDHGPSVFAAWALPGTGGGKTGTVTPTGSVATALTVNSLLANGTGVSVVGSKDASPGVFERQIAIISGTPSVRAIQKTFGQVTTFSGTGPGDYFEWLCEFIVDDGAGGPPIGLRAWSATANSTAAALGNAGATTYNADRTSKLDIVVRTPVFPVFGADTPGNIFPDIQTSWSAVALTGRVIMSRPILRRIEIAAYAPPFYLGNDTVQSGGSILRITRGGAVVTTGAVGDVLRGDPGKWSGGAISWAARQWYRDGVAISGATGWTYTTTSADAGGHVITFGPNPLNAYGGDTTTRSAGVTIS